MEKYQLNKKYYKLLLPLILLVGLFLSGVYFLSDRPDAGEETLIRAGHGLIMTAGLWLGCVGIVNWLWKKYPWQEFPRRHLLFEIVLILFYTSAYSALIYFIGRELFDYTVEINLFYDGFTTLLITYFITALHEAYYFFKQWEHHFSKSVKLEKENIEATYEALKNQMNPHFLFNSLNSLTNMVDDKPEAVRYISNLSGFLRYLLKSNESELVNVKDEIEIVEKYFTIQRSRFGESIELNIAVNNEIFERKIPPLSIQMLVENAIKHNIISKDKKLTIHIFDSFDYISVKNNLQKKSVHYSTKKGLKNIQERYKLFSSKNMIINVTKTEFEVKIPVLNIEL